MRASPLPRSDRTGGRIATYLRSCACAPDGCRGTGGDEHAHSRPGLDYGPPEWCEIRPDPPLDSALQFLDPGEHAAIALALSVNADRLPIDEQAGRAEAERRHLLVTGTLGVLAEAHRGGLLDFEVALARLRQTNFYMSADLVDRVHRRLSLRGDS